MREVAVGKSIIALLRLGELRREGVAARVDKGFRRDALGQIERAVAVDARRRREGAVVLIFRIIGKGTVLPNDVPCPDRVFFDREGVLRRGAARKGVVRIADGRGDGVAARVELAVRIGVGSIGEGDLRILPVQRRGRVSDFDLPVAAEGAVDGVLGRHRDRDRDRVRVDVEVRRNVFGQRVVFRARARDLRDRGGVAARIRLRARDRQRDIVARHRARRLRRGSLRRTVVGEGGVRPGNADRLFRNGEGSARDVQDEVRRVDGNAVRPVRGDGVVARAAGIAGELRACGAIDELQRARRDPVVHKAAAVGRVARDVGIFDGNFLPFAVRRAHPVHGHADRARRDREGDGFRLRRRVRARLVDVTDDVVGADVGRHRVGHVLGAVRVGGVAEALFAARDVAADPGLMVGVLPVRPAVGVEHDLDDELRAGDLVADRDGRAALRQSIVHTRFADLRLQPRPLIIVGIAQGERRAVHAVVAGAHVPIDGINALIRVDDEVAAVVRRVRDETVVVVGVAVDPLRLAQDIVEVDRLLFDDKGERDVALRAVRPRIVGLVRDGDGDGVAALVGVRLHVAGDGQRLAAVRQRVLFIALGHIGLRFAAVDKLALVRGRLVEPIARDAEVLRGVGRQLVVARARARDLRDFGGVVAGIRLPARDRQDDIVAVIGTRRLRCGGLLFAVVGEGGVRPGNADLLLRDREGCRKTACAFDRVVGVGNFVDRKSVAADVDRLAVRKRAARLRRHRAGEPDGVRDAVLRGEVGDRRCGVPCFPVICMGQRPPLHFDHARADRKLPRCVCGQRVVVFARARDLRDFGGVAARIRLRARDRQRDAVAVIVVRRRRRRLMRRAVVHERSVRPADRKLERRDREGEFFYGRRLAVGVRIARPLVVVAVREGQRDGVCIRIHPIAALRDVVQGTCRDVGGLRRAVVRLAAKRGDVDGLLGDRPGERLVCSLPVRPHEVGGIAEGGGDGVRPRIGRRQRAARKVGGRAARDREGDGRLDRKPGGRRPARKRGRLRAAAVCIAGVGEGRSGDLQFGDLVGDRQGVAADRVTFAADLLAPGRLVRVLDRKRRGAFARIGAAVIRDGEIARIVLPRVGHGGGLRRARVSERGKRRRLQHALADRERGELFVLHRREVTARRDADGERICTRLVGKVGFRPRAGRRAAARLAVRVGDVAAAVVVQKGEGDVVVAIPAELLAFIGAVAPFDTDRRLRGLESVDDVHFGLAFVLPAEIVGGVDELHLHGIVARFRRDEGALFGIECRHHAARMASVCDRLDPHDTFTEIVERNGLLRRRDIFAVRLILIDARRDGRKVDRDLIDPDSEITGHGVPRLGIGDDQRPAVFAVHKPFRLLGRSAGSIAVRDLDRAALQERPRQRAGHASRIGNGKSKRIRTRIVLPCRKRVDIARSADRNSLRLRRMDARDLDRAGNTALAAAHELIDRDLFIECCPFRDGRRRRQIPVDLIVHNAHDRRTPVPGIARDRQIVGQIEHDVRIGIERAALIGREHSGDGARRRIADGRAGKLDRSRRLHVAADGAELIRLLCALRKHADQLELIRAELIFLSVRTRRRDGKRLLDLLVRRSRRRRARQFDACDLGDRDVLRQGEQTDFSLPSVPPALCKRRNDPDRAPRKYRRRAQRQQQDKARPKFAFCPHIVSLRSLPRADGARR